MRRRCGNPNWGQPPQSLRALPTEFEILVKWLGLAKLEYVSSADLKRWCEHNRNRVYIPEWLLDGYISRGDLQRRGLTPASEETRFHFT
jgi:hypothetical protein